MSYNGSGTFLIQTSGNPVQAGTTISSTWANNTLNEIAAGLSIAICKDGQTTTTAQIPFASGLWSTDSGLAIKNAGDVSKVVKFSAAALTTGFTRTFTLPDTSDTLVTLAATQALTNKTISGLTVSTTTGTLAIANSKTLTVNNSPILAGTDGTYTFQGTDTYVGRATTDTLTNKTLDTAGAGNSFLIAGVAVTANTGTGAVARASSPIFTTPNIDAATATSVNKVAITAPASSATLTIANLKTLTANSSLTLAGTDGKTLTTNASLTLGGTDGKALTLTNSLTLAGTDSTTITFQGSDTYVGRNTTDILTGKTINGASNTLSNIGNSSLTNSSLTIGSTSVSLGGTVATINGLTLGSNCALGTPLSGNLSNCTGTATSLTAGASNNLSGGSGGSVPYQSGAGATQMLANGSSGQVLTSLGGSSAPQWTIPNGMTDPATNLIIFDEFAHESNKTLFVQASNSALLLPDASDGALKVVGDGTNSGHTYLQDYNHGPFIIKAFPISRNPSFSTRLKNAAGGATARLFGFVDDYNGGVSPVNGVYFSFMDVGAGVHYHCISRKAGSTMQDVDSLVNVDNNYHDFKIVISGGNTATFYLDGSQVAQITGTNLPTVSLGVWFTSGAAASGAGLWTQYARIVQARF